MLSFPGLGFIGLGRHPLEPLHSTPGILFWGDLLEDLLGFCVFDPSEVRFLDPFCACVQAIVMQGFKGSDWTFLFLARTVRTLKGFYAEIITRNPQTVVYIGFRQALNLKPTPHLQYFSGDPLKPKRIPYSKPKA